jgi:hypothetical protein
MAHHVGACAAELMPLYELIKAHVFAAERIKAWNARSLGDEPIVRVILEARWCAFGLTARPRRSRFWWCSACVKTVKNCFWL